MDPFEQFIRDNKDQLKHRPKDREALWSKIEKDIKPRNTAIVKRLNWSRWVAAACILLVIGVGLTWLSKGNQNDSQMAEHKPLEVIEIDAHYQKLINTRVKQVKSSQALTEEQKDEITQYLSKLEKEAVTLEQELKLNINNVQIIQAISNNYRARLEVMEKLLDRSTNNNNNKNEKNISI